MTGYVKMKIRSCLKLCSDILVRKTASRGNYVRTNSSLVRYNYNEECEDHINDHIVLELYAGYLYMSMAFYFDQSLLSLPGFHKQFFKWSNEEFEHAHILMYFQNKRGGKLKYCDIKAPPQCEWTPALAVYESIKAEKMIMKSFDEMLEKAEKHRDHHLCDFIEGVFLTDQYEALKILNNLYTNIQRVGDTEGLFILDQTLLKNVSKSKTNNGD